VCAGRPIAAADSARDWLRSATHGAALLVTVNLSLAAATLVAAVRMRFRRSPFTSSKISCGLPTDHFGGRNRALGQVCVRVSGQW